MILSSWIVYIEAQACGKPVIGALNGGGAREAMQDGKTGFLVDNSPESVAEGVLRLINDPMLCENMGKNGRQFVLDQFSWEQFLEGWRNILI